MGKDLWLSEQTHKVLKILPLNFCRIPVLPLVCSSKIETCVVIFQLIYHLKPVNYHNPLDYLDPSD